MNIPEVNMPYGFEEMNALPGDPPNSKVYGYESPGTISRVLVRFIPAGETLFFDDPQVLSNMIIQEAEDGKLVESETVRTYEKDRRCVHSIVKTLSDQDRIRYWATMYIDYPDGMVLIQGFFDTLGESEMREILVQAIQTGKGIVRMTDKGLIGWDLESYDPEYRHESGEDSDHWEFDQLFPDHPLTEARRFVNELLMLN